MPRDRYPEHDEEIIELYEAGWSLASIAEHICWSKAFVRNRLVRHGVQLRARGGNRRHVASTDIAKTIFLYRECGYSLEGVATVQGLSRSGVRRRLVAAGVDLRPRGTAGRQLVQRRPS